jgi:hypothetical protein
VRSEQRPQIVDRVCLLGILVRPVALDAGEASFGPDSDLDIPGLALVTAGAFGIVWGSYAAIRPAGPASR